MVTNKNTDIKVGTVIEGRRRKCGITQSDIAGLAGISTVYYRDIAFGRSRPNWAIMGTICSVLKINMAKLVEIYVLPDLIETDTDLDLKP